MYITLQGIEEISASDLKLLSFTKFLSVTDKSNSNRYKIACS